MKIAGLIMLLCLLLSIVLFISASRQAQKNLSETLNIGEEQLIERNYDQALEQFFKVMEIDPEYPRAYTGTAEAYLGLDDTENAIAILRQGQSIIEEDTSITDKLDEIHREEEARIRAEIEAEEARIQAEIEAEALRIQGEIEAEAARIRAEIDAQIRDALDSFYEIYELGDFGEFRVMLNSEEFEELLTKTDNTPFIYLDDTENYGIGIYDGGIYDGGYIYIGEYSDSLRSGFGFWMGSATRNNYNYLWRFVGTWANDKPNGSGTIFYNDDHGWQASMTGTLVDGLFHGTIVDLFAIEYDNGRVVPLQDERTRRRDGIRWWPVGAAVDGNGLLYMSEEQMAVLYGVVPYADYS